MPNKPGRTASGRSTRSKPHTKAEARRTGVAKRGQRRRASVQGQLQKRAAAAQKTDKRVALTARAGQMAQARRRAFLGQVAQAGVQRVSKKRGKITRKKR